MLVAKYEINGAELEVYDDFYINSTDKELKKIEENFSDIAQNMIKCNQYKNSQDSLSF